MESKNVNPRHSINKDISVAISSAKSVFLSDYILQGIFWGFAMFLASSVWAQPAFVWARSIGGTNDDGGSHLAMDAKGNLYSIGNFQGTVDFDAGPGTYYLDSEGYTDIFISKLDAAGKFVWAKRIYGYDLGWGPFNEAFAIAVDSSENVYIVGLFYGALDIDPGEAIHYLSSSGLCDIFILKLDANGNFLWAKQLGGPGEDAAYSLTLDDRGNPYMAGWFTGPADFDPGPAEHLVANSGGFLLKMDSAGNIIWIKNSPGQVRINSITVKAGNVYGTGFFSGAVDFDPGANVFSLSGDRGPGDIFVTRFDTAGNFVWAKAMSGTNGSDWGYSVAVDASGNVITTGTFTSSSVDFDPGPGTFFLARAGSLDVFVSKLNANGNFLWAKKLAGPDREDGVCLSIDESGNIYTIGGFAGTVDFDPGPATFNLVSANYDIFLSKLDASGNFIWAKQFGNSGYNFGTSILSGFSGDLYLTGTFSGNVDFDPGAGTFNLSALGRTDIFVVKLVDVVSSPLPLLLLDLSVTQGKNSNQLQWKTASEQHTSEFIIERSEGNGMFSSIGRVTAAGNSSSVLNYAFTDMQPLRGQSFYRLKMVDTDGSFLYSNIVLVNRTSMQEALRISPVPVQDVLQVEAYGNGQAILQVLNATGTVVLQKEITMKDASSFSLNVHHLPAGTYYLMVLNQGDRNVRAFVKN